MNFTEIINTALSIEGIRDFFTVYEDGELCLDQVWGSIIQLLIFSSLIAVIGYFLL